MALATSMLEPRPADRDNRAHRKVHQHRRNYSDHA
jgi:hypothetical protein